MTVKLDRDRLGGGSAELDREFTLAADDVFLLDAVVVHGCGHSLFRIHQLFAILWLVGEVHKDEAVALPVAEPEVGDIPLRIRR